MTVEEEVREELRTLALTDFDRFLKVANVDLVTLEICKRRKKDQSLRQIARLMQMPASTVSDKCKLC